MSGLIKPTIVGTDFVKPPKPKRQAIALIAGLPGEGKTTMGLSGAPDPVVFIDIDKRGLHAAQAAQKDGKVIHYLDVTMPQVNKLNDVQVKAEAQKAWSRLMKNYEGAIRASLKGDVRTIVIDTGSLLTDLAKLVVSGRTDKKNDDYGRSKHIEKTMITNLMKMSREGLANLLVLCHAKEVWYDNKPTGKFTYIGSEVLEADADIAGHLRLRRDSKKVRKIQKRELEMFKAGIDGTQLGEVYTDDDWDDMGPFVYMCVMNYPGTSPDDWT